MSAHLEREYLKSVYPNPKWHSRVDKMGDEQVIAIFIRVKGVALILKDTIDPEPESPDQLRLF